MPGGHKTGRVCLSEREAAHGREPATGVALALKGQGPGGWAAELCVFGGPSRAVWVIVSPGDSKGPAGSLLALGTSLDPILS